VTVLDSHLYRNPLDVLLREEAKTCRGCVHRVRWQAFGIPVTACSKPNETGKPRKNGRRCKDYKEEQDVSRT